MSALFVTATGTDIGKTYVSAGLLRHLHGQGRKVAALKPVLSGFDGAPGSDPARLLEAMGEAATPGAIAQIAPWRFNAALSPDVAAAREGRSIDFEALVAFCRTEAVATGTLLIEGAGGVMAPLDARHTMLDWMKALGFPVLLLTGSYLGSISHALSAVVVLERGGLKIAALVLNDSGDNPMPLADTAATLRRFLPHVPLATLPRPAKEADFAALSARLFPGGAA
jgi:dethiobiotin synthetase